MDPIASWLVISIVVERLVEIIAEMFPAIHKLDNKYVEPKLIIALGLGFLFSFGANLNFFAMFGIIFTFPYVGESVSAVFIAAGSAYVHRVISEITAQRRKIDEEDLASEVKKVVYNLQSLKRIVDDVNNPNNCEDKK